MKNVFQGPKTIVVAALFVLLIVTVAWQRDDEIKQDSTSKYYGNRDTTVPKQRNYDKNELTVKDIDNAMKELDIELQKMNVELKNMNIEISKSIKDAMSQLDMEKINKELSEEMKKVDFAKIQDEVNSSLKEAQAEISKVDMEKIQREVNQSLKDAQQKIKKADMEKVQLEMKDLENKLNNGELKKQIEESMKDAKIQMEKAKKELLQLKEFTDALQKDGLIDKDKRFSIEWKNGEDLYINGEKQPKEISDKYKKYYKEDGYQFNIGNDIEGESI